MNVKRVAGAAVIAASVGIFGLSVATPANADPGQWCNRGNCQGPSGHGRGGQDAGRHDGDNRHWDGPPRDIDQARFDHQPFNYNDYEAVPVWAPDMGGWGFWFFGVWIPL